MFGAELGLSGGMCMAELRNAHGGGVCGGTGIRKLLFLESRGRNREPEQVYLWRGIGESACVIFEVR